MTLPPPRASQSPCPPSACLCTCPHASDSSATTLESREMFWDSGVHQALLLRPCAPKVHQQTIFVILCGPTRFCFFFCPPFFSYDFSVCPLFLLQNPPFSFLLKNVVKWNLNFFKTRRCWKSPFFPHPLRALLFFIILWDDYVMNMIWFINTYM